METSNAEKLTSGFGYIGKGLLAVCLISALYTLSFLALLFAILIAVFIGYII